MEKEVAEGSRGGTEVATLVLNANILCFQHLAIFFLLESQRPCKLYVAY